MRRGILVGLAVAAAGAICAGVFLAGLGSGVALVDLRGRVRSLPNASELATGDASSHDEPKCATLEPPQPGRDAATLAPDSPSTALPTPIATVGPTSAPTTDDDPRDTFGVLREVWSILEEEYYGPLPDDAAVVYAAIRGVLGAVDDENTIFIEPRSAAILSEDAGGELQGVGAYVGLDEAGRLEIIRPFDDGPARDAGLSAGDRILEVDGVPLSGKSLYESIALIRGPAGTSVRLLIARPGVPDPFPTVITRARVDIPTATSRLIDGGIGYIRLHAFNAAACESLEDELMKLLVESPAGMVLDLRQNPGGWLDQAVSVSDLFLSEGVILVERWSDGREDVYRARPGDVGEQIPLVVLVDGGSASASEIVGGALQDNGRATLVGEVTYGKGSVQRPHTLSDGSELRVTIAVWLTPRGNTIGAEGLMPDLIVRWPEDAAGIEGKDPQLARAIELLQADVP